VGDIKIRKMFERTGTRYRYFGKSVLKKRCRVSSEIYTNSEIYRVLNDKNFRDHGMRAISG